METLRGLDANWLIARGKKTVRGYRVLILGLKTKTSNDYTSFLFLSFPSPSLHNHHPPHNCIGQIDRNLDVFNRHYRSPNYLRNFSPLFQSGITALRLLFGVRYRAPFGSFLTGIMLCVCVGGYRAIIFSRSIYTAVVANISTRYLCCIYVALMFGWYHVYAVLRL